MPKYDNFDLDLQVSNSAKEKDPPPYPTYKQTITVYLFACCIIED